MEILKRDIKKWTDALRSGKYKKTKRTLQDAKGYCCLGVACDLFIDPEKLLLDYCGLLLGLVPSTQPHSPEWLNKLNEDFFYKTGVSLSTLNDKGIDLHLEPFSFDEIADLLEAVYIHEVLEGGDRAAN